MLIALGIIITLAWWVALLHWHGVVDEAQAAEAERLEAWNRRLTAETARQPYDQDRAEGVVDIYWRTTPNDSLERAWFPWEAGTVLQAAEPDDPKADQ